ncbi:MAG: hypothetical protein M1281_06490 [Chloroflexi bacterium]|nr:hypothetical protein [Chloroflexota bacterium]
MSEKSVAFLPFRAINEFMREDYRQTVVSTVLHALPDLPEARRNALNRQIKKYVQIPGFRNSALAPLSLKIKISISTFQKSSDFAANLLAEWSNQNEELRQNVLNLLTSRGWELLPSDADRTKLPGFLTRWPAGEDFEVLYKAYQEMYPDSHSSSDDVSLMTVWLSGRLPVEKVERE